MFVQIYSHEEEAQCQTRTKQLDLSIPAHEGLDVLPSLRKQAPSARILILTMHDDPQYMRQALKYDASGYVLKKAADAELLSAMRGDARRKFMYILRLTRILLEDLLPRAQQTTNENAWDSLSEREREVLKLVALGHTSAEIAKQLGLSTKTVEAYRARGMEKTGFANSGCIGSIRTARGIN